MESEGHSATLDHGTVNSFLRGIEYPLARDELVELAKVNRVPDELVAALRGLPKRRYESQQGVMEDLQREGNRLS